MLLHDFFIHMPFHFTIHTMYDSFYASKQALSVKIQIYFHYGDQMMFSLKKNYIFDKVGALFFRL